MLLAENRGQGSGMLGSQDLPADGHEILASPARPMPVVAETVRRTSAAASAGPERLNYRVDAGSRTGTQMTLEQRRESSHLQGLPNVLKDT